MKITYDKIADAVYLTLKKGRVAKTLEAGEDFMVDQNAFDDFMKACSRKGFAPQVVLEQAMRKFAQNGQL